MVDFCSKCGAIIMGEKGQNVACPACGHKNKASSEVKLTQKVEKTVEKEIVDTNSDVEIHPTTNTVECPQCGHNEARYFSKQMRAGDEPETQFYKCTKCRHQWRKHM